MSDKFCSHCHNYPSDDCPNIGQMECLATRTFCDQAPVQTTDWHCVRCNLLYKNVKRGECLECKSADFSVNCSLRPHTTPNDNYTLVVGDDGPVVPLSMHMREPLRAFAVAMEQKLRKNDHKTDWRTKPIEAFVRLLKLELAEFEVADEFFTVEEARKELVDIANFALILHDRLGMIDQNKNRRTQEEQK